MAFQSLEANDATKPKPKVSKPRSLPPPGEAFVTSKRPLKRSEKSKPVPKKIAATKKKPAKPTNLTKPKASGKQSNGSVQVAAGNGVSKAAPAKKAKQAKPAKEKPMSIYKEVLSQSNGTDNLFGSPKKRRQQQQVESVLMRRTAASQQVRGGMEKTSIIRKLGLYQKNLKMVKKVGGSEKPFRVVDLPKELREMVWYHAVVNLRAFVWPERYTGHEQPDLAMTCRLVRNEVLPIFYAENIFAVNLSPKLNRSYRNTDEVAKGKKRVVLSGGIPVAAEWAKALQAVGSKPDWFSMVRRWAFSYSDRAEGLRFLNRLASGEVEKDFVVTVNFSKRQHGGSFWDASVEIHQSALCVLRGYEEYGTCKVQTAPAWWNDLIIAITEAAKGGDISEGMITGLAKEIEDKAAPLQEMRCEEVLPSAEPFCDR